MVYAEKGGYHLYNSLLTAFVRVADSGSFNKAAEALYVSPPGRDETDQRLGNPFGYETAGAHQPWRTFDAGKVIYRHARYLFEYSARAVAEARREEEAGKTTFCIGSSLLIHVSRLWISGIRFAGILPATR